MLRSRSFSIETALAPVLLGNNVEINPENCPGSKIAGISFENHFHFSCSRSLSDGADEDERRESLLEGLATHYARDNSWLAHPWGEQDRFSSDDFSISLRVQTMDGSGNLTTAGLINIRKLLYLQPKAKAAPRILVRGNPSFGKTTMCNKIAHDWSNRSKIFSGYRKNLTVVLYIKLKYLAENAHLENELLKLALQRDTVTTSDDDYLAFLKLLKSSGKFVVILLDGYDEVGVHLKLQVKDLLKSRPDSIFKTASMIITCRPNDDTDLLTLVNGQFILNGLSEGTSLKLMKRYFCETEKYCAAFYKRTVKQLEQRDVSPLLLHMLCYCGNIEDLDMNLRMCDLYRRLIFLIAQNSSEGKSLSEDEIKDKLHKLGEFFWICLERKQTVFKLDELAYYLSSDSNFALNCGLIKRLGGRNCEPVHMVLMEILAAAYLETSCLLHSSIHRMFQFIRYNFRNVEYLNMYYYTDLEGEITFRLDFDYRGFRFSYKLLQNGDEKCTVLMKNLLNSWDDNEKCLCLCFRISLTDRNKKTVLKIFPQLFPDHPLPIILSDFISSSVFSHLCLKFIIDCESDTNVHFSRLRELPEANDQIANYEPSPLLSLMNIADELILGFLKPSCTPEMIIAVLNHLAIHGDTSCLTNALEFLKCLQSGSCSLRFVVAHLHSSDAYAKVSSSVVTTNIKTSRILWFLFGPNFSWQNCNRMEILLRKEDD